MIDSLIRKANKLSWFVMRCQNPEKMEKFIDIYNANESVAPDDKVEDLFIPSLAIKKRVLTRSANDDPAFADTRREGDEDVKSNELHSTLRRFVFLYTRPSAFDKLENHLATQYWNVGRTHLTHYVDGSRHAITVMPNKMNIFISACLEYHEKFEMHIKDTEIKNGVQVTVRKGAFKDFKAEVYNVHYKSEGVRFSIAIKFFANDRYIHIHDRRPEDVVLADEDSPVFSSDFINRIQSDILSILSRRVHKKDSAEAQDAEKRQLSKLYHLRHAIIDDRLLSVQLDALMSICASLNRNYLEKSRYNRIIKQRIKEVRGWESGSLHQTALAYLLTALYISTKDARYRTELKRIVRNELPKHKALGQFLSLIRR